MVVAKATIISNVFEEFYDLLNTNITSVIVTGSVTVKVQKYTNSFPDNSVTQKSDYPILITNSPEINWEEFTFSKTNVSGTIRIEIFATQLEAADKFLDLINNTIETNKRVLRIKGIEEIKLSGTDRDDFFDRGGIKLHLRAAIFSFNFKFDKGSSGY